jgi:predicted O-methyltransferase YrrM
MNYDNYPPHCNFPDSDWENFHKNHIPNWNTLLNELKGKKDTVGIEIGSFCGGSAVWCLENIFDKETGFLYCIDIEQTEYLKNNLAPYKNVKFIKGDSFCVLKSLNHNGKEEEFADLIYIDGSHIAKNVLEDLVLSWRMLKQNGIMVMDDYGWGYDRHDKEKPQTAIDAFLYIYQDLYEVLHVGWQVFIKKKPYVMRDDVLQKTYDTNV